MPCKLVHTTHVYLYIKEASHKFGELMRSLENLQMAKRASKIKVRCRQTPVYQEFLSVLHHATHSFRLITVENSIKKTSSKYCFLDLTFNADKYF